RNELDSSRATRRSVTARCPRCSFSGGRFMSRHSPARADRRPGWAVSAVVLLACFASLGTGGGQAARRDRVGVGIVDTLFRDIPRKTVDATAEPFRELMEKESGRKGDFEFVSGAYEL